MFRWGRQELVAPDDGFLRLLAADSESFYFTKRGDSGGVLYRGDPSGGPRRVLAEGVGGWASGAGVVHDGYLYHCDRGADDGLFRIPTSGGEREQLASALSSVKELAAASGTVYIGHGSADSALDVDTGDVSQKVTTSVFEAYALAATEGFLVWTTGATLEAMDLTTGNGPAVVYDQSTDCPEEEEFSFQRLDIIGTRDGEILFIEHTFSRYDTGDHWSNGDPRWGVHRPAASALGHGRGLPPEMPAFGLPTVAGWRAFVKPVHGCSASLRPCG